LFNDGIVVFDSNLSLINRYGTGTSSSSPSPGQFWGPRRFVAILNDRFYCIDEGLPGDNIVSFSDFDFTNWQRYANGFTFFSFC